MIRARDTDVPLPKQLPVTLATDGSSDTMTIYCTAIHSLADIAGEEKDKARKLSKEYILLLDIDIPHST